MFVPSNYLPYLEDGSEIPAGSDLLGYGVSDRPAQMMSGLCVFIYSADMTECSILYQRCVKRRSGKVSEMIGTKINGLNKALCVGISQCDLARLYE